MTIKRSQMLIVVLITAMVFLPLFAAFGAKPAAPVTLDPKTIPKYINQLVANIPVFTPSSSGFDPTTGKPYEKYSIDMVTWREQILPTGTPLIGSIDGQTNVWGYAGPAKNVVTGSTIPYFINSPSATFEAKRGTEFDVTWNNLITTNQPFAVDPTLMWANPNNMATPVPPVTAPIFPPGYDAPAQSNVALVPHLHGGEVQSFYDGNPNAWWTATGTKGLFYTTNVYQYPNEQEPATLWYHDHALGITRLNVMSGLAGFYLIREPLTATGPGVNTFDQYLTTHFPYGVSEIPLAIQDRTFQTNGELWFPSLGINPTIHPYWVPEFFGDTIMVNGKVWPNLDVTPGWYRFRLLDGSNARFYTLSFSNKMPFIVIGADGGYLQKAATVTSITIAPGERADILVDFTAVPLGSKITLTNTAKAPFPNGAPADPQTVGQIMQFTVKTTSANTGAAAPTLQTSLNPVVLPGATFPTLTTINNKRIMTLIEVMGPADPQMVTINGQSFDGFLTETPKNGDTEDWVIVNLTADTHPIHTHLATFQVISRQPFQATKYLNDWMAINAPLGVLPLPNGVKPNNPDPTPYLQKKPTGPLPTEMGWKDTVKMNPGEVTVIRIRFTSQNGAPFPFDPTQGPGYVWHCHIIDHEDNEMMRPYMVMP